MTDSACEGKVSEPILDLTALIIIASLRNISATVFFWLISTHLGTMGQGVLSTLSLVGAAAILVVSVISHIHPNKLLAPGPISTVFSCGIAMAASLFLLLTFPETFETVSAPLAHLMVVCVTLGHATASSAFIRRSEQA